MINEKIEELRKVLPHDLRQATKKRNYSLGKGATHCHENCVIICEVLISLCIRLDNNCWIVCVWTFVIVNKSVTISNKQFYNLNADLHVKNIWKLCVTPSKGGRSCSQRSIQPSQIDTLNTVVQESNKDWPNDWPNLILQTYLVLTTDMFDYFRQNQLRFNHCK